MVIITLAEKTSNKLVIDIDTDKLNPKTMWPLSSAYHSHTPRKFELREGYEVGILTSKRFRSYFEKVPALNSFF